MSDTASLFMSDADLTRLTGGLRQGAARMRWLARHKIPFLPGADGQPSVLRSAVEHAMGTVTKQKRATEPNADALKKYTSNGQKTN